MEKKGLNAEVGRTTGRVLVKVGEEQSGGCKIEKYEWIDATPAQLLAYGNNDPNWRDAKPETAWFSRLWHRLTRDA